jgi:branched-chain amino acid transport system substrate-binding protein
VVANSLTVFTAVPLRGERAAEGRAVLRGEKLALSEAGGEVGGLKVQIAVRDDTDAKSRMVTPGQAAANARAAVQNPSTIAYIGSLDTASTAVSLPITNEAGLLQVSPLSNYTGLTRTSDKGEPEKYYPAGTRTFARLVPDGRIEARALTGWLREEGVARVALVGDGHQAAQGTERDLSAALERARVEIVEDMVIDENDEDLDGPARDLAERRPDAVVYVGGTPAGAARLLRAVHAVAPAIDLFATSASAYGPFARLLGPAASRVQVTNAVLPPAADNPDVQRMARGYRRAFGTSPPPAALYGYEAMRSVLEAIRAAGRDAKSRPTVIARYLGAVHPSSVLGRYRVSGEGDTSQTAYGAYRVSDGRLRFVRRLE